MDSTVLNCVAAGKFADGECLRLLVAEALNVALMLGSLIVKLPQVYSIVTSKSVEGLSPASFYLDTLVSTFNGTYQYLQGYRFINYADSVFSTVQNGALVLLMWYYSKGAKRPSAVEMGVVVAVGAALTVLALHTPVHLRFLLQFVITPLMIWSRGAQIVQNFTTKSTGSLSLITNVLLFLGSSAKIFTIISQNMSAKTSDGSLITSNALASILSGIIVIQIISYHDSSTTATMRRKKAE